MMGYGLAKAAVHQLTKSLAQDKSGLPSGKGLDSSKGSKN